MSDPRPIRVWCTSCHCYEETTERVPFPICVKGNDAKAPWPPPHWSIDKTPATRVMGRGTRERQRVAREAFRAELERKAARR